MDVQAEIKWVGGLQFVARAGDGPAVVMDSRETGGGPSPMEMVLMGVAGCTAIDVVMIMQKRRANITDFQVNISGTRADEYPRRYTHIQIEYVLHGRGLKVKDVERAIELSETKYCSATASLNAEIEHSYRIIDMDEMDA